MWCLMSDNLKNIPFALQLSRRSQTIIFQNLDFFSGGHCGAGGVGAWGFTCPCRLASSDMKEVPFWSV